LNSRFPTDHAPIEVIERVYQIQAPQFARTSRRRNRKDDGIPTAAAELLARYRTSEPRVNFAKTAPIRQKMYLFSGIHPIKTIGKIETERPNSAATDTGE
jgi:hypothetical protein